MNKTIKKQIFKVLEDECKEYRIDIGGTHCFNFIEDFKKKNYAVTIIIQELKKDSVYRCIDKTKKKRVKK